MRTVNQLAVPKEADLVEFPDSTVINEEPGIDGTPVIREIYGDVLTNIYAILRDAGVTANGGEDNETNGYQFLQALKQFANDVNDVERLLTFLAPNRIIVDMDLTKLPGNYVFIGRATFDSDPGISSYALRGNAGFPPNYALTPNISFLTGDILLFVLSESGDTPVFNLSKLTRKENLSLTYGVPIRYNSIIGSELFYNSNGTILTDEPTAVNLQDQIRVASGDALAEIRDMSVLLSHVLCLVYLPGTITYQFWQFSLSDLNTPIFVPTNGWAFPIGTDNGPVIYGNNNLLRITNDAGQNANDNDIRQVNYNPVTPETTLGGLNTIDASFVKTENGVFAQGFATPGVYTLIGSILQFFPLFGGGPTLLLDLNGVTGSIFIVDSDVYFSRNGENARIWDIF